MINVSSEFRDKLNNGNCNYLSYADITLKDGTTLNLTNDDIWNGGVTIEDAVSTGTFEVGSVVINQCTIVINNIYDKFTKYDFKEAVVRAQLGTDLNETEFDIDADDETESSYTPRIEKIKKGVYTVDDTKYNGSIITLTCIDNMGKFDRAYSESKLEYPATLKAIVMDACDICGVTLNTPDFSHSDYIINTRPTDAAVTFREVIAWCGQISGNYCRCNVNGQLELKWFNQSLLEKTLINLIPDSLFDDGIASWKAVDSKIGTDTIEYKEMLSIIPDAGKTGYAVEAVSNLKLATNYTIGGQFFMQYPEDNDVAIVKILNGTKEIASKEIELNDGWTGFRFDFVSTSQNVSINIGFKGDNTLYVYKPYLEEKIPDEIYQFNGVYNSDVATDDVVITGVNVMEKEDTVDTDSDIEEEAEDTTSSSDGYKNYQTGTAGYIISIENNELIKDGAGQTVSGFLGEQLIGFAFRKATITHISDPTLEAGDVAILTDSKFDRYKILVSSTKFNTNNSQTTSSNAESTEKNSAVRYSAATKNYVEYRKQIVQEKTDRQKALEELKDRLNKASGTYTTIVKDSAGGQIFYLHNKPQLKDSDMIWKMTAEAWGVSTDGGKTYNAGMTVDGDTIVRYLKATGLTADVITSGRIQVKDSLGNVIFLVDMDTGAVQISGNNIVIGGKSAPDAISDAVKESKNYADGKVSDFAETVTKSVADLQNQIDGQIETFYYDYEPTLKNIPASDWTTEDDKKKHEGDLFYWKSKGYAYRFFKDGDTWKWQLVQDTDVTKALQTASFAQSTANSKCRVFLTQPTPPYDTGDMWNQGQNGDILTCVVARADGASYVETDWQKLNKYTDDETANKALEEARKSRAMIINLDNDYQAITTDYKGEYTSFPECHTTAQVLYGHTDISNDCTYNVQKSGGVVGSWNNSTHTYTVTALTTDVGWVDITANYLNTYSVTKRFDIAKLKGGIPGETGAKGDKGETGASGRSITGSETTYQASSSGTTAPTGTWSKTPPSVAENQYLWTRTIYTYSDKTTSTTYSIGKMGAKGEQGAKGETGATGPQGEKGAKGNDGVSPTVSISKSGTVTTITITDKNGTHTQTVNDGTNGTAGKAGADGKTPYFHVKYSNDGGKTFTSNSGEDVGTYIGTCTDYNQADPTTVGSYTWARIKGETGATGAKGETGATGPQGPQGNIGPTGNGIKSTAITYQVSSSGTAVPTGTWSGSVPSTSAGQYLWTRTITTYTNNTTTTSYSVSRNGSNGAKGDKGDQGSVGRTYFMETSSSIVKMSADNTIVPNYITLSGYYRDGTATARTAYKCRFKIEETTDGDTYTTVYTSSADETDITHALYSVLASGSSGITASGSSGIGISRNLTALRCTMYAAGGFSQVLDIETIPVAIDVDALTHEDIFNLLTNDGAWQGIYRGSDGKLYINFTYARGGTLNLGGKANTYGNGQMHVYDANDNEIVDINTKGIVVTHYISGMGEKPISYVCITPDVFGGIYLSENKDGTGACAILSPDEIVLKNNSSGPITVQTDITMHMTDESLYLGSVSNYKFHFGKEKSSFYQPVTIGGSLSVAGTKNRIIDTENYDTRKQYCYETATPYFGDIGSGCTDNTGKCYIDINDIFSETVNTGVEYQVFLQKEGQGDIWVEEKTDSYFVVKGTENLKFSWEIKAIQKDYEFERLEKFDNSEKEEVIDYEKEYMEEINDLIKEQEEMLNETVE